MPPPLRPLSDADLERLDVLLNTLPSPCAPPDLSALDGFLVGVVVQPALVPEARWLPFIHDFDNGAPAPPHVDLEPLHALVRRRHGELTAAIGARRWFDPWVFELEPANRDAPIEPAEMVLPWVAGWAAALERFPALLAQAGDEAREPLATLYACFDPDDLEDIDDLADLVDEIGPPQSTTEAVENLVRCNLLLADAMRPRAVSKRR